jgi:hypothetical protein
MSHALKPIARIFRKVRCAGSRGRAVNRRQQHKVTAGLLIFPPPIFTPNRWWPNQTEKILLPTLRGVCAATDAAAMLASQVTGRGKGYLVDEGVRNLSFLFLRISA